MPFGFFLRLTGIFILPLLAGGDGQIGYRSTTGQVSGFRILADIAYQNYFIDAATCHVVISS
jgi:hypothetical protein